MERKKKTQPTRIKVRNWWTTNYRKASNYGFSESVLNLILDDHEDLKICWCCGQQGYQEICHIKPNMLGGSVDLNNLFLLCSECHVNSPDFSDKEFFVQWVNDNVDSFSSRLNKELVSMITLARDAEKSGYDIQVVCDDIVGVFKESFQKVGLHSASISSSSKITVFRSTAKAIKLKYSTDT